MSVESRDDDRLVEEAWSAVAPGYEEYWSPRLQPFIERAIAAFAPAVAGPLAIPGCGPGEEALAEEVAKGVTVLAVNPGVVATDMLRTCFQGAIAGATPPEECARAFVAMLRRVTPAWNGRSVDL